MLESPELRWGFIRKIYTILSVQLLLTILVASVVVYVRPIAHFFVSSPIGLALTIVLTIMPFIGIYIYYLNNLYLNILMILKLYTQCSSLCIFTIRSIL